MVIDKYTKAVLTLIAISLFVISLNPWIAPTKAYAELDSGDLSGIERYARGIYSGTCLNSKIC
jgi:hypothetical protein